jgi:Thiamine pyrophosphate enzyme, central domain
MMQREIGARSFKDADRLADAIIQTVGKKIVLALPLGLGKANHIANALFARASADASIRLDIFTALTLEKPRARNEIERRFLAPLAERLFDGYPSLDYAAAIRTGTLPTNIQVNEFFFQAGQWLGVPGAQQSYISANYTHALRYVLDRGVNVVAQLVARRVRGIAIHQATAKRGVSVLVMPGDVAVQPASDAAPAKAEGLVASPPTVIPPERDLERLAALLNADGRVTLLCGSGCAGAHDQIVALAERLKAPIVHALKGKEHVEWNNPYDVGMTGLIGFASGYYAMFDCDVLLMLGTDFPYRQFYPRGRGAKIAQVDIRGEVIGRRVPVDLGVVGDVRATIDALLPRLKTHDDSGHLDQARKHYKKAREEFNALAVSRSGKPPIHPQQVAKAPRTPRSSIGGLRLDRTRTEVTVLNSSSAPRDLILK